MSEPLRPEAEGAAPATLPDPRLAAAEAVVVGCGAAGSAAAEGLARAGVGKLTLVDLDVVLHRNLATHSLVSVEDAERCREKAVAVADALRTVAPDVEVVPVVTELGLDNADELLAGARLVVDATDTRGAHLLVDAAVRRSGTPWVLARTEGRIAVVAAFHPPAPPCVRCASGALDSLASPPEDPWARAERTALASSAARLAGALAVERGLALLLSGVASGVVAVRAGTDPVAVSAVEPGGPGFPPCPCLFGEVPVPSEEERSGMERRSPGAYHFPAPPGARVDVRSLALRLTGWRVVRSSALSVTVQGEGASVTRFADGRLVVRGAVDPRRARELAARLTKV